MRTRQLNVLIVDDERETLTLMKLALGRAGFSVLAAANWEEMTGLIEISYRNKRPIDVIILDLMMPERSGLDILRSLQVVFSPMPPVIMLSAVTSIEQQIKARDMGVTKYMTKPTTPTKLIEAIKDIISKTGR